jgi:glycosyltransferase involved in cell wall biosynthesis
VEQQSIMEMLVDRGHKVVLLTSCERGYLHEYAEKLGVITEAIDAGKHISKLSFYLANIKKLNEVLGSRKIDIVIAHQQITALIAGMLRIIKRFPLIYIRHNSDEDYYLNRRKAALYNRVVNSLTPIKVAPSTAVHDFWIFNEKAAIHQIHRINYGYNFNQYEKPVDHKVNEIKRAYPTALRILSIARLVTSKRHELMFSVVSRLIKEGVDCKFICIGSGPLEFTLADRITGLQMQNHIFLLGRKENVFDYIEASDVFMHLSLAEASNSAVKEVALCRKPVIVCKQVGDFDDYIVNDESGFIINKEAPEEEAVKILKNIANGEIDKNKIGNRLFQSVTSIFEIDNVIKRYEALFTTI